MRPSNTIEIRRAGSRLAPVISFVGMLALVSAIPVAGADTMMKESSKQMDTSMGATMPEGQSMQKDGMMHQENKEMESSGMMGKQGDSMEKAGMQEMPEKETGMMGQEMKK